MRRSNGTSRHLMLNTTVANIYISHTLNIMQSRFSHLHGGGHRRNCRRYTGRTGIPLVAVAPQYAQSRQLHDTMVAPVVVGAQNNGTNVMPCCLLLLALHQFAPVCRLAQCRRSSFLVEFY